MIVDALLYAANMRLVLVGRGLENLTAPGAAWYFTVALDRV